MIDVLLSDQNMRERIMKKDQENEKDLLLFNLQKCFHLPFSISSDPHFLVIPTVQVRRMAISLMSL